MKSKKLPSNTMSQRQQPPVQQPPPPPSAQQQSSGSEIGELTPNSSSSPYTITSSLSSSSSSLPPPQHQAAAAAPPAVSMPNITMLPDKPFKNSKQSSLLSLKSVESSGTSDKRQSASSLCSSHKCLISIWSTWYCLLVTGLHIYLIRNRIVDIVTLFSINNSDLFSSSQLNSTANLAAAANNTLNMSQLNASIFFEIVSRICLAVLSILFLVLFLLCSLKPLGNYANDGVKFGRDFFYEKIQHNHLEAKKVVTMHRRQPAKSPGLKHNPSTRHSASTSGSCFANLLDIIWRHFLPANSFCHLVSILLLIFSRVIFDEAAKSVRSYSTVKECLANKFITGPCLLNFFLTQANQSIGMFYSATADDSTPNTFYLIEQIASFKFELISICLAFISIYIRYGSVFWFTNKPLSFLITFIGFIGAVEQLLQLYSFVYIYEQLNLNEQINWANYFLKENGSIFKTAPPPLPTDTLPGVQQATARESSFLGTFAASFEFTFLIKNKFTLLFLYFTLSMLVYLSATPAYVFAFLKYKERFAIEECLFVRTISSRNRKSDDCGSLTTSSSSSSASTDEQQAQAARLPVYRRNHKEQCVNNSTCCFNYCPHLIATIQLVLICASKLPFCYDYVIYFNKYKDSGICLVIVVEILHTIMLIFIWLLLTLKSEWNMHLQTAFSICHWTYHLKTKQPDDEHSPGNKYQSKSIKTITGSVSAAPPLDVKKPMTTELAGNAYSIQTLNRTRQADLNDYNDYSEQQQQQQHKVNMNNYEQNNKFATLLTYQPISHNNELNRHSVIIRNNNNNSNNIYASCNTNANANRHQQRQNMIETKHKSLIERYDDNNIYNANFVDLIENNNNNNNKKPNSDYLMNSETLYRNEIRKSIRNIMQQKRTNPATTPANTNGTLVTSASMAHLLNQHKHQAIMEQHSAAAAAVGANREPFYYHQSSGMVDTMGKKQLVGGLYLSSTTPTVIDNSSVKMPTITHILTSTICSTTTNPQLPLPPTQQQQPNPASKNRSVLYLERRSSSSNEYESRV